MNYNFYDINSKKINIPEDGTYRLKVVDRKSGDLINTFIKRVLDPSVDESENPRYRVKTILKNDKKSRSATIKYTDDLNFKKGFNQYRLKAVSHQGFASNSHYMLLYSEDGKTITDAVDPIVGNTFDIIDSYINDYVSNIMLESELKDLFLSNGFIDSAKTDMFVLFHELMKMDVLESTSINSSTYPNTFKELIDLQPEEELKTEDEFIDKLTEILDVNIEEVISSFVDYLSKVEDDVDLTAIEEIFFSKLVNIGPDSVGYLFEDLTEIAIDSYISERLDDFFDDQINVIFDHGDSYDAAVVDVFKHWIKSNVSNIFVDFQKRDSITLLTKDLVEMIVRLSFEENIEIILSESKNHNLTKKSLVSDYFNDSFKDYEIYDSLTELINKEGHTSDVINGLFSEIIKETINDYKTFLSTVSEVEKIETNDEYSFLIEVLAKDILILNIKDAFKQKINYWKKEKYPYEIQNAINAYTYHLDKNIVNGFLVDRRTQSKIETINKELEINLKDLLKKAEVSEFIDALPYLLVEDVTSMVREINDVINAYKSLDENIKEKYSLFSAISDFIGVYFTQKEKINEFLNIYNSEKIINRFLDYKKIPKDKAEVLSLENLFMYINRYLKDSFSTVKTDNISFLEIIKEEKNYLFGDISESLFHEKGDFYGSHYFDESLFYDIMGIARMGRVKMGFGPDSIN